MKPLTLPIGQFGSLSLGHFYFALTPGYKTLTLLRIYDIFS